MNDVRSYVCSNEITVYILAKISRYTLKNNRCYLLQARRDYSSWTITRSCSEK